MTELFRAVQNSLRTYKQRGVDLAHPMGVVVFDKHYPATEKGLFLRETASGDISKNFNAHHIVPLESGMAVGGWAAVGENGTSLDHKLRKPLIRTAESNPWQRHGWIVSGGTNSGIMEHSIHDVNDSNGIYFHPREQQDLHEHMKEWSLEPTHGLTTKNNRDYNDMSSEAHREHQQNVRSSLLKHPSKITVTVFKSPNRTERFRAVQETTRDVFEGFDSYQYDIATEALTPWSWRDIYSDDEFGPGG